MRLCSQIPSSFHKAERTLYYYTCKRISECCSKHDSLMARSTFKEAGAGIIWSSTIICNLLVTLPLARWMKSYCLVPSILGLTGTYATCNTLLPLMLVVRLVSEPVRWAWSHFSQNRCYRRESRVSLSKRITNAFSLASVTSCTNWKSIMHLGSPTKFTICFEFLNLFNPVTYALFS